MDIAQVINEYGFPIVATVGLLYMIYFIWGFITNQIKAKLGETMVTLVGLIDRIRMLDNDIIRLQQKFFLIIAIILSLGNVSADEMRHRFSNPSFSGIGASAHWLTIENQEHSRKETRKEEAEAKIEEGERAKQNTTLARFIRNLESRIYAELSRQLVDNMFGETKSESGSFELEGNKVDYSTDGSIVSLTVTDKSGGTTTISVPIGDFYF